MAGLLGGLLGGVKLAALAGGLALIAWVANDYAAARAAQARLALQFEMAAAANRSLLEAAAETAADLARADAALQEAQRRERTLAAELAGQAAALAALRGQDCQPAEDLQRWLDGLRGRDS